MINTLYNIGVDKYKSYSYVDGYLLQIPVNDKQEFTEVQRDVLREYEELVKELVRQKKGFDQ